MTGTSYIELSESALRNNIQFLRNTIGDKCLLSSVIKGNAYGHGIEVYVPLAEKCGVNHFSVFSANEAYRAKSVAAPATDIMIMGMMDEPDMDWVLDNDISFFVFDPPRLEMALRAAKRKNKKARIHIELETGMNRTGFEKNALPKLVATVLANPNWLQVEGICTHYAGAENIANYFRIQKQMRTFESFLKRLQALHPENIKKHTACSAAAMTYPKTRMDMVRIGIMQYGFWSSKETLMHYLGRRDDKTDPLLRVISWKTRVMSTQHVKAGEFVGYGTSYMAEKDMRIAIVPVGYSQGYSRSLSNQGRILVNGRRVSVVGVVNMNMLVADITNIPETQPGDEVVLIGRQGDLSISVSSFSELSDQLNYELLTRLPHDIKRVRSL